jgi:hypothetical protein
MEQKAVLTEQEIREKRKFERYEIYLPVKFRLFSAEGKDVAEKTIEGFTRNFSKEGLLLDFSDSELNLSPEEAIGITIRGEIMLPMLDTPVSFDGEIKWFKRVGSSKYFLGILLTRIDDFQRLQLLLFSKKVNRKSKIITSLIFILFLTAGLAIMTVFSFNAYINKLTTKQQYVYTELNARVSFLTDKLNEIATKISKQNKD